MRIMVRYPHLYKERRPFVKLQEGIAFGRGRKLALFVCLAALAGVYADGLTPMYGNTAGSDYNNKTIQQTVTWYSDEAMTSTAGVITPWQEGSNTCRYAILGTAKIGTTCAECA